MLLKKKKWKYLRVLSYSMDGFRVVKLSEVIRQMDVVITCTGTAPPAVTSITYAMIITVSSANKHALIHSNKKQTTPKSDCQHVTTTVYMLL